ncbi:MAG: hypothetical protein DRJ07_12800 [Bacteroidetes bacterium]|nr:MAG: hypothetical protein DRJ07_12800 [Bacteroidota bacterium]
MSLGFLKYFAPFLIILAMISCPGITRKEKMVEEYVQGNSLLPAGGELKISSLRKSGVLRASDSLKLFIEQYSDGSGNGDSLNYEKILQTCKLTVEKYNELIDDLQPKVTELQEKVNLIDDTVQDKQKVLTNLETINTYESYLKSLQLSRNLKSKYEKLYRDLNHYYQFQDKVLGNKYSCILEFSSEKDTIYKLRQTYLFNLSEDKVYGVLID